MRHRSLCGAAKLLFIRSWPGFSRAEHGSQAIRGLHSTIARLKTLREQLAVADGPGEDRLSAFSDFGSNPGALQAWSYVPESLPPGAPLVVVLHGCTQTAAGYDRSAGWSRAAADHGFALLFPEQQRANNSNLCFNWFAPEDVRRGRGEVLSIRQMVAAMQARFGTDPKRVFVTGLSAGGAMTAAMLATYPDVFAGGAIIAGLPFGTARSVPEAFDRMRGHGGAGPEELGARVRRASSHAGPWPIVSVWHGTADATVDPSNGRAIVDQWRVMHGAPAAPSRTETVSGYPRRVWTDERGRDVIEEYVITGMGHGTPLHTAGGYGESAAPFMLEAGISSTRRIAGFWGIDKHFAARERAGADAAVPARPEAKGSPPSSGVQKTIEDALRAAGLLR